MWKYVKKFDLYIPSPMDSLQVSRHGLRRIVKVLQKIIITKSTKVNISVTHLNSKLPSIEIDVVNDGQFLKFIFS